MKLFFKLDFPKQKIDQLRAQQLKKLNTILRFKN